MGRMFCWPGWAARRAFTLLELLVVVVVIAILAALLLPALSGAKERARRANCLSRVRQFILATHLYANDHEDRLPSPQTDNANKDDTHTPILSSPMLTNLVRYSDEPRIYDCPSFQRILAPHCASGPEVRDDAYFAEHPEAFSQTPADIGAKGGNVGLLDGSVRWRSLREMKAWRASQLWDTQGAFGFW